MLVGFVVLGNHEYAGGIFVEPVNKQLWTVSYTVLTAGLATLALVLCLWLVDVRDWRRLTRPAVVFGINPLVAFLGSGLLARVIGLVHVQDGERTSLQAWLYRELCVPVAGDTNGSLLYAVANVAVWLVILGCFDRRGWHVKI